jgi:hypothetical protein
MSINYISSHAHQIGFKIFCHVYYTAGLCLKQYFVQIIEQQRFYMEQKDCFTSRVTVHVLSNLNSKRTYNSRF